MSSLRLGDRLRTELEGRRVLNPRYSARAFAAYLAADHSTLSQVLLGRRAATAEQVRAWGHKLQMGSEEIAVYTRAECAPRMRMGAASDPMREWMAEAAEVMTQVVHWEIVRRCRVNAHSPDCRVLATEVGVTVDDVQNALARLLRLRLMAIRDSGEWSDLTGDAALTESAFRQLALRRIRESAGVTPAGVAREVETNALAPR
jgi:hypothetical protein